MVEPSTVSAALTILRGAGVSVINGNLSDWTLRMPDGTHRVVQAKAFSRNPGPSFFRSAGPTNSHNHVLIITTAGSPFLVKEAHDGKIDLVEVNSGAVIINGYEWTKPKPSQEPKGSAKPAWGRWGLMRALYISLDPQSQVELARSVGISQSAVSMILRDLHDVTHNERGWQAKDKEHLLRAWRDTYPGPRGASTYWYGLSSITQQAQGATQVADELEIRHLVTGDVAADEMAPWRLPTSAHIYLDEFVDFSVMNLTPTDPAEATLVATVPDDPTIWHTAQYRRSPATSADPLIVYWDVLHSIGPDAEEAAAKVLEAIPT
jgi:hypothetical protein